MKRTLADWLRRELSRLSLAALRGEHYVLKYPPAWERNTPQPPPGTELQAEIITHAGALSHAVIQLGHRADDLISWLILNPPQERLGADHPSSAALGGLLGFHLPAHQDRAYSRQLQLTLLGESFASFDHSRRQWGQDNVSGLVKGGVSAAQRQNLIQSLTEEISRIPPEQRRLAGEWMIRALGLRTRAAVALWATLTPQGSEADLWPSLHAAWSRRAPVMLGELQGRSHPLGVGEMSPPEWTPLNTPQSAPPTTPAELMTLLEEVRRLPVIGITNRRPSPADQQPGETPPEDGQFASTLLDNLAFLRRVSEHELRGWLSQMPGMLPGMDGVIMHVLAGGHAARSAWSTDPEQLADQMRLMRAALPQFERADAPSDQFETDTLTMLRQSHSYDRRHWRMPSAVSQIHLLHWVLKTGRQELALMAALLTQLPLSASRAYEQAPSTPRLRLEHEALQLAAQAALIRLEWRVSDHVEFTSHAMQLALPPGSHSLMGSAQPEPQLPLSDLIHWLSAEPAGNQGGPTPT